MRLSKERKIYAVFIGVAGAGLGAVFFLSGPGAAMTEAAAAAVDVDSKPVAKAPAETETGGDLLSLATKLKSFETSHNLSAPADAFKPSSAWTPAKPKVDLAIVTTQAVDAFKGAHQLSAVLVAGPHSHAIVDGRTYGIGQTLAGYKLVAVTPKTVVFISGGNKVVLRVPVPDQIVAIDVR